MSDFCVGLCSLHKFVSLTYRFYIFPLIIIIIIIITVIISVMNLLCNADSAKCFGSNLVISHRHHICNRPTNNSTTSYTVCRCQYVYDLSAVRTGLSQHGGRVV